VRQNCRLLSVHTQFAVALGMVRIRAHDFGSLAQSGEHVPVTHEVRGSKPLRVARAGRVNGGNGKRMKAEVCVSEPSL
jgi:hypothetical protein